MHLSNPFCHKYKFGNIRESSFPVISQACHLNSNLDRRTQLQDTQNPTRLPKRDPHVFEQFHSCQSADGNFMCWEHGAARRKPNVKLRSAEVTTNKSLDVCHLEWVDPDFDKKLGLPCGRRLLSNCFQLTELFYTALLGRQKHKFVSSRCKFTMSQHSRSCWYKCFFGWENGHLPYYLRLNQATLGPVPSTAQGT